MGGLVERDRPAIAFDNRQVDAQLNDLDPKTKVGSGGRKELLVDDRVGAGMRRRWLGPVEQKQRAACDQGQENQPDQNQPQATGARLGAHQATLTSLSVARLRCCWLNPPG